MDGKGRVIVRGKTVKRGEAKKADYLLFYKPNLPLAVLEAKDNNHSVGAGMAQGIGRVMIEKGMPPFVMYPQILWATFALVLGISFVSALIGIIKVSRVDAASVFRG